MVVDTALAWGVVEKVVIAAVGYGLRYFFERKTRLVVFFGHVGEFHLAPTTSSPQGMTVHTHSVELRNAGRLPANKVRIPHKVLIGPGGANVSIRPSIAYTKNVLPNGGEEIQFDTLAPQQQVTLSYLYFPPLFVGQIHEPIRCDEVMARVVNVLPTIVYPRWVKAIAWVVLLVGFVTIVYFGVELVRLIWPWLSSRM
jgi:hypothetical protein